MTANRESLPEFSGKESPRKPLAVSNWKMSMTVAEGIEWLQEFRALAGDLLQAVDVVVCPPFTTLRPVWEVMKDSPIQLGGQDVSAYTDVARTGEISAKLLVDAGCQWVLLGHWEARRYSGDDDHSVNRKVHVAIEAGLRPILLVGEARDEDSSSMVALRARLSRTLGGCRAEEAARMAFIYEPEAAIGADEPTGMERVGEGCRTIRTWVSERWGESVGRAAPIIYGGSVSPEHAGRLLSIPDLDGLGASRKGRDPEAFYEIVRQIVSVKGVG